MNYFIYHYKKWVLCTVIFSVGLIVGFLSRNRLVPGERLFDQSTTLTRIAEDAMLYRATPKRVEEKVEAKLKVKVKWETSADQKTGVLVLPPETGFLGMGARWILCLKLGSDGRCDHAWTQVQGVGYP